MKATLSQKDFEKNVAGSTLTLIQFKTEWNGACQIIAPLYEDLANVYAGSVNFFLLDIEKEKNIAHKYRITELPTILFFKQGEVIDHVMGLSPKASIIAKIEAALSTNN